MVNQQRNDEGLRELALFAGAGGGILGGHLLGWRTVCAVEYNAYARSVLLARQNDGTLPPFAIWDDVRTFDGKPWRGIVDVVSGGFPCQDLSCAGTGAGLDGERSGLWSEMARIIGEVRPRYAFIENSPMLVNRGLDRVLSDLAAMGFDAEWGVLSAADTGAPHLRERVWIVANARSGRCGEPGKGEDQQQGRAEAVGASEAVANADRVRQLQPAGDQQDERAWLGVSGEDVANAMRQRQQGIVAGCTGSQEREKPRARPFGPCGDGFGRWPVEPGVCRVVDGLANRPDRIKALGNGQVPRVAAAAFSILSAE